MHIQVYPGHGQPRFENLTTAVAVMIQYIRDFQQALADAGGNKTFVAGKCHCLTFTHSHSHAYIKRKCVCVCD
jgi:hypothetical protein